MTRRAAVPTQKHARTVLDTYLRACREDGKRPSVLALATRLGLSNTTFRRHFPDLAHHITALRTQPATAVLPADEKGAQRPSPYEVLVARNVKLRRRNRELTDNLHYAAAHLQRLAIDNARLKQALETQAGITRINQAGHHRTH